MDLFLFGSAFGKCTAMHRDAPTPANTSALSLLDQGLTALFRSSAHSRAIEAGHPRAPAAVSGGALGGRPVRAAVGRALVQALALAGGAAPCDEHVLIGLVDVVVVGLALGADVSLELGEVGGVRLARRGASNLHLERSDCVAKVVQVVEVRTILDPELSSNPPSSNFTFTQCRGIPS